MYSCVDATSLDMQPIENNNRIWMIFFMFFMLVGSYLFINLFVGVIIDNFNKMRKKSEGNMTMLTAEQQQWVKTREIVSKIKPKKKSFPPGYALGDKCFAIITKQKFEMSIMGAILLNTLIMAMEFFGQPDGYTTFLEVMNYIFALIFTVEAVLKLLALKKAYFAENWNRFDFAIVLGTNAGLLVYWIVGQNYSTVATIVRIFRIGRLFRLINGAETINQLFNTLILTLPGLGNIGALLFLLFFIYSVMGVQLFATVQYYEALNEHANFRSFWRAMLTLFTIFNR